MTCIKIPEIFSLDEIISALEDACSVLHDVGLDESNDALSLLLMEARNTKAALDAALVTE